MVKNPSIAIREAIDAATKQMIGFGVPADQAKAIAQCQARTMCAVYEAGDHDRAAGKERGRAAAIARQVRRSGVL